MILIYLLLLNRRGRKLEDKVAMLISIKDDNERMVKIEELGDELEYKRYSCELVCNLINKLLELAIEEPNTIIKESCFHTINIAINNYNAIDYLNLDELIKRLDTYNDELLDYVIGFIGKTKNNKYKDLLIQYLNSSNDSIVESAKEALNELYGKLIY